MIIKEENKEQNKTNQNIPRLRFKEFSSEWKEKKLGGVSNINPSNKLIPDTFIYIDLESVVNGTLVKENQIEKFDSPSRAQRFLKKNDILFQTVRPYQMNNLFFDRVGDYVASTGYAQIRTFESSKYLYYCLHTQNFVDKVMDRCIGTSYPAINSSDLSNIYISLPSLSEQTKIAEFLGTVDERIVSLKAKKTLLEEYKKGIMAKIFSKLIRFLDENGNDYPAWEEKKLGNCVQYIQPTKYLVSSTEYSNTYKIPVLTAGKTFLLGYTNETEGVFNKNLPVIIFDDFTTATQFVDFPFKAKSSAMKILSAKDGVNIKIVFELMRNLKYEVGGHERHWISKFSEIFIPLPSLPEQTKIANFLTSLDESITLVNEQISTSEEYKKGLLQKMFV